MKIKRVIISVFLVCVLLCGAVYVVTSGNSLVPILMYHSVENENTFKTPTVSPENFDLQMEFLKQKGFSVISLDKYVEASKVSGEKLPYRTVVITFDDGYENNFKYAYPILKRTAFPATIFIPPQYIGRKGYLTQDYLQVMLENKITIGAHSRSHRYIPSLNARDLKEEIDTAKNDLENMLGVPVNLFCYPIGGYTNKARRFLKDAGYIAACTTNRSPSVFNKDLYALNRIKMTNRDNNAFILLGKTSRVYNLMRNIRNYFRNRKK
ncbi:polysaccharide deacetylase family protein [Candidatus Auribacterota bacterium]